MSLALYPLRVRSSDLLGVIFDPPDQNTGERHIPQAETFLQTSGIPNDTSLRHRYCNKEADHRYYFCTKIRLLDPKPSRESLVVKGVGQTRVSFWGGALP